MTVVVTLGESLLRLTPPSYGLIKQAQTFEVDFGGSEANVAVALSSMGLKTRFVSKVPKNTLADTSLQVLKSHGVDTSAVLRGGERFGLYFLEKGFSLRSSSVIYDRTHSAFATSHLDEYDFDALFHEATWFHTSGITPALSPHHFELTKTFLSEAKKRGLTTSFDLNYRSALWSFSEARDKLSQLMDHVDICIGIEPLNCLDSKGRDIKDDLQRPYDLMQIEPILAQLQKAFSFKAIALTSRRVESAHKNIIQSAFYDGNLSLSPRIEVEIIDRVGTGDAFTSGIIYGLLNQFNQQKTIDFAQASFALKHTISGDLSLLTSEAIESFIRESTTQEIQR